MAPRDTPVSTVTESSRFVIPHGQRMPALAVVLLRFRRGRAVRPARLVTSTDGAPRRAIGGGAECRSIAPAPAPAGARLPRPAARSARPRPSYLLALPGGGLAG